jgi:Methyltransferase domain
LKRIIKSGLNKLGYNVTKTPKRNDNEDLDPSLYSAAEGGGTEVPCQKETYYYALNNYVKDGDKVLDVGIGAGYGMNLLSIKAKELYGVDVDSKSIEHCKKLVLGKNPKVKEIKKYDGYKLPFKDNSFDVVTCVDVVEHVEDYDRFIDELLRVSKRVVVFGTPNRRPEYTNEDGTPKNHWHLREWSYKEFDEIARSHSKKVDWVFLDGPWEGPFAVRDKVSKDTLVLLPVLHKQSVMKRSNRAE